jgi:hypothetical protein
MKTLQRKPRCRRGQRGQAMVEYSMINWLLVVALVLGSTVRIIPIGAAKGNVIDLFLTAYQTYYDSFYFVLNSPFP